MRRPSPLPSSPARPRPAEEEPLAPVVPLAGPWTRTAETVAPEADAADALDAGEPAPDGGGEPTAAGDDGGDGAESAERPLGVRDVWAAARARRRALRREIRRFTQRQRRRRLIWLTAIGAVLAVGLGAVALAYSPVFAVRQITVVGTATLDAQTVAEALSSQRGTPLAIVDSSEIKAALVAFPLVESYSVEANPPNELVVRIVERTPIGSIASSSGHTLVDAAGVALSTTPDAPKGFPVLDVEDGVGSRAFDAVGRVFRSLPDGIRSQVTAMSATTANDVTLTLGETRVVWGGASDSAAKAVNLEAAMQARPPADVSVYDVSSPGAVVIR